MRRRIAYIVSRFPHLPETFILREMVELEKQGWEIFLYPLVVQQPSIIHAEAKPWISRTHRMPYLSGNMLTTNARTVVRRPRQYASLLGQSLWENRTSLKFLSRTLALFPKAICAAAMMRREGIGHIHAHYASHPALAAWLIHHLTNISYSVTVHAHDIFVRHEMLATKLRDASFIAAISEYNCEYLARTIGSWARKKTAIVHCGIRPTDYTLRVETDRANKRFEILNIASLQPYKGHRFLIEACALLRDRGIPFRCRIIGGGQEHPKLEAQITQARLGDCVELLGALAQEKVARILPTADCYVQPSIITHTGKMEGIPVALMEAFACGLPVVATSISGIPELVRPEKTGWLVPPANSAALADALATVYADPHQSEALAQAGRALVLKEFDLTANVEKLAACFRRALDHSSSN